MRNRRAAVPEGREGTGGAVRELVLLGTALERPSTSFTPNGLGSLENGSEEPRETLGDSVFRVLEL